MTPVFILIIILIKLSQINDKVFYKQERIGRGGELFTIYKFRTMNNSDSISTISIKGDNRITPIGIKLRKYKLDELPELWNVLCGDMSFVGPRPDVPGYADKLKGNESRIHSLRPGITGPASLKYINEEELLETVADPIIYNDTIIYPDKVRINLLYLDNWSVWLDLKIIWHTIIRKKFNESNYFHKI